MTSDRKPTTTRYAVDILRALHAADDQARHRDFYIGLARMHGVSEAQIADCLGTVSGVEAIVQVA